MTFQICSIRGTHICFHISKLKETTLTVISIKLEKISFDYVWATLQHLCMFGESCHCEEWCEQKVKSVLPASPVPGAECKSCDWATTPILCSNQSQVDKQRSGTVAAVMPAPQGSSTVVPREASCHLGFRSDISALVHGMIWGSSWRCLSLPEDSVGLVSHLPWYDLDDPGLARLRFAWSWDTWVTEAEKVFIKLSTHPDVHINN